MRILMLSWEFPPHSVGGLGKHVADIVPALAAQGTEVHVVTPALRGGSAQETVCPGATVHRVGMPPTALDQPGLVPLVQLCNSVLEQYAHELHANHGGFDLIHGHDWTVAYSSVALKHALRLPLIATIHSMEWGRTQGHLGNDESRVINDVERWLTFEAWRVVTVSHFMAQQVQRHFHLPGDKLDVIYNGVEAPQRHPMTARQRTAFRRDYAAKDDQIVYYVGRLVHEKGVQVLIDALPLVLNRTPNIKCVIAGTGPCLNDLRQQAHERGVAERCVFTGFISDDARDKLYQVADVAVFPSLYEPFGIVALEAMTYGCPVVASQTGGLAEFIQPHETGILAQPGDAGSLAWGIEHTLQHPEWTAARVRNALRETAEHFNWPRIATQTLATYERVQRERQQTTWSDHTATP